MANSRPALAPLACSAGSRRQVPGDLRSALRPLPDAGAPGARPPASPVSIEPSRLPHPLAGSWTPSNLSFLEGGRDSQGMRRGVEKIVETEEGREKTEARLLGVGRAEKARNWAALGS